MGGCVDGSLDLKRDFVAAVSGYDTVVAGFGGQGMEFGDDFLDFHYGDWCVRIILMVWCGSETVSEC